MRLREGDREIEISGTAEFVRESLEQLPRMLSRLAPAPSVGMPAVPARWREPGRATAPVDAEPAPVTAAPPSVNAPTPAATAHSHAAVEPVRRAIDSSASAATQTQGAPASAQPNVEAITEPVRPRRGRPPGSANRPKSAGPVAQNGEHQGADGADLEQQLLLVLRASSSPLPVAAIRQQLPDRVSAQQIRRVLERSNSVRTDGEHPSRYSAR